MTDGNCLDSSNAVLDVEMEYHEVLAVFLPDELYQVAASVIWTVERWTSFSHALNELGCNQAHGALSLLRHSAPPYEEENETKTRTFLALLLAR